MATVLHNRYPDHLTTARVRTLPEYATATAPVVTKAPTSVAYVEGLCRVLIESELRDVLPRRFPDTWFGVGFDRAVTRDSKLYSHTRYRRALLLDAQQQLHARREQAQRALLLARIADNTEAYDAQQQILTRLDNEALTLDRAVDALHRQVDEWVEARRNALVAKNVERRLAKLLARAPHTAVQQLNDRRISQAFRRWVHKQYRAGAFKLPINRVLVLLLVRSYLRDNTSPPDGNDYLASIPLVVAGLDARERQNVLRAVNAPVVLSAHPNQDRRDYLADFEYHGLPEDMRALRLAQFKPCANCKSPIVDGIRRSRCDEARCECGHRSAGLDCQPKYVVFERCSCEETLLSPWLDSWAAAAAVKAQRDFVPPSPFSYR